MHIFKPNYFLLLLYVGTVVAGLIGSTLRMEYTVIGDAVNIAARTASSAIRNQILMTESTFSLISEKLEVKEAGKREFKGKAMPIPCFEVVSLKPNTSNDYAYLPPMPEKMH